MSATSTSALEFTDHYEIEEADRGVLSFAEARALAGDDDQRVWSIRSGDEQEEWDVELYHGQFVNILGFFVSTRPCAPEHRDQLFTY